jgi:putative copper export protein
MAVGPFLDWMSVRRQGTITGIKSQPRGTWLIGSVPDGYIVLALAAVALLCAISFSNASRRGKAQLLAAAGLAGVAVAGLSWLGFKRHIDDLKRLGVFFTLSPPPVGFWLAAVGAIFVFLGGLAAQSHAKRIR